MPDPVATPFRRHWRFYRTSTGGEVVSNELDALRADAAAALVAEMRVVARLGLKDGGARQLALRVFPKKTQQTPTQEIDLAE